MNDTAPTFVSSNETAMMENIPIKTIDRDEGRKSYIEYSLLAQTAEEDDGPFILGPVNGLLRVSASLDRESRANYMLHMVAYDRDLPSRSSSLDVSVRVLDENYNSPLFEPKVYSASVSENATIGLSVLQVSASDVDEGLNGRVRYTIVGGDVNFDFYIGEDCEAKATTRAAARRPRRSDFVAMGIHQGRARFMYGGSQTTIVSITAPKPVADSKWYRVTATRKASGRFLSCDTDFCITIRVTVPMSLRTFRWKNGCWRMDRGTT